MISTSPSKYHLDLKKNHCRLAADSKRKGEPPQPKEIPLQGKRETPKKKAETLGHLFVSTQNHELSVPERLQVRLDDRTHLLLKKLNVAKDIDMTKIISFSLHQFLGTHTELSRYIK